MTLQHSPLPLFLLLLHPLHLIIIEPTLVMSSTMQLFRFIQQKRNRGKEKHSSLCEPPSTPPSILIPFVSFDNPTQKEGKKDDYFDNFFSSSSCYHKIMKLIRYYDNWSIEFKTNLYGGEMPNSPTLIGNTGIQQFQRISNTSKEI